MQTASFHRFDTRLFHADSIRGVVGESLKLEDAYYLGKIIGTIARHESIDRAIIGYDARGSSSVLEAELARGLIAAGLKVMSIGQCSASLLWFVYYEMQPGLGIIITGDDHSGEENGFRIVMGSRPFYGDALKQIVKIALNGNWRFGEGGSYIFGNAHNAYVKKMLACVRLENPELRVIWHAAAGLGELFLPPLKASLAGSHEIIPDQGAGFETVKQLLQKQITDTQADIGFAIDAQCDCLTVIDDKARPVDADRLLPVLLNHLTDNQPQGKKILIDNLASRVITDALAQQGVVCERLRGNRAQFQYKMREQDFFLGLDMAGRFFFGKDLFYGIDDVFFTALKILELGNDGRSVSEKIDALPYSVISPVETIAVSRGQARKHDEALQKSLTRDQIPYRNDGGITVTRDTGWYVIRIEPDNDRIMIRAEARDHDSFAAVRDEMLKYMQEAEILEIINS